MYRLTSLLNKKKTFFERMYHRTRDEHLKAHWHKHSTDTRTQHDWPLWVSEPLLWFWNEKAHFFRSSSGRSCQEQTWNLGPGSLLHSPTESLHPASTRVAPNIVQQHITAKHCVTEGKQLWLIHISSWKTLMKNIWNLHYKSKVFNLHTVNTV